ncbi:MAG: hypothetical protein AAGA55_08160, partial [Planctomycetota bacterium]
FAASAAAVLGYPYPGARGVTIRRTTEKVAIDAREATDGLVCGAVLNRVAMCVGDLGVLSDSPPVPFRYTDYAGDGKRLPRHGP